MAINKDAMTALKGLTDENKFRSIKKEEEKDVKVRTTLFVRKDLYTQLKVAAAKHNKSITDLLTEGMQFAVEKYKD